MSDQNTSFQFQQILNDPEIYDELREKLHAGKLRRVADAGLPERAIIESLESVSVSTVPPAGMESIRSVSSPPRRGPAPPNAPDMATEAIVLEFGRPSLIIQDGTFEIPESSVWRRELTLHKTAIEAAIRSVARVELLNHFTFDWVGTCWVVAPNILVTNRHVAETFANRNSDNTFSFATNIIGQDIGARADFREEHERSESAEVKVEKILYVAPSGPGNPDIAVLRVAGDAELPPPLELSDKKPDRDQMVSVIGYPAFDTRNGLDAMRRYFGEVYDVKRIAPGKVKIHDDSAHFFLTDYTSLGGNSGSAVIDLESGKVVGLHFAGRFREANFAVKVDAIKTALASVSVSLPTTPGTAAATAEAPEADKTHPPEHYTGRDGYRENFLGHGHSVPLPGLGRWSDDAAPVEGAPSESPWLARYRHFSVVISKSRKLPVLTAVNINGMESRSVPRIRDWYLDGRISLDHQAGNEVYKHNDLDRGHMVRRLDPVWGDFQTASEANDDSFHYTNSAPQHKLLNQHDWVDLESKILDHAGARDFRISVITGPVLRDNDPEYRSIRLPREFWKVVAMVDPDGDKLAAMGFVLSHSHLVRDLEESLFQPGSLKVYQVPIPEVESRTRLDFSAYKPIDTLAGDGAESVPGKAVAFREIENAEDIKFA